MTRVARTAHRLLRARDPAANVAPPGWTVEGDRADEYAELSAMRVLRKTS